MGGAKENLVCSLESMTLRHGRRSHAQDVPYNVVSSESLLRSEAVDASADVASGGEGWFGMY